MSWTRKLPIGAEVVSADEVDFRVWAPRRRHVEVVFEESSRPAVVLTAEGKGYFSGRAAAKAGALYRYRLDNETTLFPDPASRFQPDGPHGPSQVADPGEFSWSDSSWPGVGLEGQVIYEMHIGTFTRQGTWAAASRELAELASIGITVAEVMPVADFPGRFGWGYDGVNLFAPTRLYGSPDDFRRFVDRAHAVGLGVILDVVYNHLGPDGNYLRQFSDAYFTDRHKNEWGEALNFDGPDAGPVREFFVANAGYWIDEFHLDGLRLDATHQIFDSSADNIQAAITRKVREAARGRRTLVVAENDAQHANLVRPAAHGGYGMDAVWNDDFHHSAMVALTGRREAYFSDFRGEPQEFISAAKLGFLFQGQYYSWNKRRRGTPALDLPPAHFITFLQNHDQVAHSARGLRCRQLTSPGRFRALTAVLLLSPGTPMLFQGQEFGASAPFLYFADHHKELAALVAKGRRQFLAQFPSLASPELAAKLADPADAATFEQCRLDFGERERHAEVYKLHKDLLKLRRADPVLRLQRQRGVDGAVLGPHAWVLRFFAPDGMDRLLLVNLGAGSNVNPAPEPLLAPPAECRWTTLWSSEDPRYGGDGTPPLEGDDNWHLAAESAVAMLPVPLAASRSQPVSEREAASGSL
jgi:maltooligosyltrehalose trehalohydrolase